VAYIVNQDIIDRVGNDAAVQLTTDSGAAVDTDVLDEVRESAEGEVNGYLARRYAVPVDLTTHTDLAATLKGFTLDVAVYRLHARRPPVSESIRELRTDAIKWLTAVSEGKVVLPAEVTPASTTSDDPAPTTGYSPSRGLGGEDGIQHW
jgi:phage gp36-like protein